MAKKQGKDVISLPENTEIEVIAINSQGTFKKNMTVGQFRELKKVKGSVYIPYQKGFSQFNNPKII